MKIQKTIKQMKKTKKNQTKMQKRTGVKQKWLKCLIKGTFAQNIWFELALEKFTDV